VSHLAGATAWSQGRWRAAAAHWEDAIAGSPHDLFALRCAHDAYAVLGDGAAMRGSLARVVPHWDAGIPGYASVLGMYAWSLHEAGLMAAAEETAGVSQSLDPSDGWANLSTVATLLAQGRWSESLSFLRHAADEWEAHEGAGCAAIVPWLHWYKTQVLLDQGVWDTLLWTWDRLYAGDGGLRTQYPAPDLVPAAPGGAGGGGGGGGAAEPAPTHLSHDLLCSAGLLWQAERVCGMDGGARWQELYARWASPRALRGARGWALRDVHLMMVLASEAASSRAALEEAGLSATAGSEAVETAAEAAAEQLLSSMRAFAEGRPADGGAVAWSTGMVAGPPAFVPGPPAVAAADEVAAAAAAAADDARWATGALGVPCCEAVLAFTRGDHATVVEKLLPLRYHLGRLGGAPAQRDVLEQTLIVACFRDGQFEVARALLSERATLRPGSPLVWKWQADALDGLGEDVKAQRAFKHAQTLGFRQGGWGAH
jgi:Flp pilus assembly protein TadD